MLQLAYTSIACQVLKRREILSLLQQARLFNRQHNITGILLYKEQSFFQVIEGEDAIIKKLMGSIREDYRHYDINLLFEREVTRRHFDLWSMGYMDVERSDVDIESGSADGFDFPLQNIKGNLRELVNISTAKHLVLSYSRQSSA